jgi:5-formyltetrahydrofolate cyclo-ligase
MAERKRNPAKIQLRQKMRKKRLALAPAYREKASREMYRQLYHRQSFQASRTVFAYVSMPEEVQLLPFLRYCLEEGKHVAVPYITGPGRMEATLLQSLDDLTTDAYGISSVREDKRKIISPENIDFVIVPGLAFTSQGARLGMGGGFYDRFLKRCPDAIRQALTFDALMLADGMIPMTEEDAWMDGVLTETRSFSCQRHEAFQG